MEKINFENLPSTNTPINTTNLNQLQDNIENAISSIIESGSNENGNWMKFDNGTMKCWGNKTLGNISCSTEWGGLYQGTVTDLITYPQTFTVVDHLEITAIPTTSASFWTMMATREYETTGYSGIYFIRPTEATVAPFISWQAIGKWK